MSRNVSLVAALEAQASRFETPCGEGSMVWRRWGEGAPVLLLHGGSGSWRHWMRNIEALSAAHAIWVPDLPAFGESASPTEPYDLPAYAAILVAGLRRLIGEAPFDLVGFSLGSIVAEGIAAALPGQIRRLVLVRGNYGASTQDPTTALRKWRSITDPAELASVLRHNLGVLMFADPAHIDDLTVAIYGEDLRRSRMKPGAFRGSRDPELLRRLAVPVCAIAGERDAYALPSVAAQGEALHRKRPDAAFHIVEGAGHWVMYEAAERFNALLLQALA